MSLYIFAPAWILDAVLGMAVRYGNFKKESVEVNGRLCHYYDNHKIDKPVLIMVHGFGDRKESWFPFVNRFTKDYHVILPDAFGHGENARDSSVTYTFDEQSHFMSDLTQALSLDDFHLVGISMGGGIAGKFAILYPEDLLSLTLISSAGIQDCSNRSALDLMMEQYPTIAEKKSHFPLLPETYSRANAKLFKEYIFHKKVFTPSRLLKVYMVPVIEEREFFIDVLEDFVDIQTGAFLDPLDDELHQIKCPVLVIWGKQDPLLDASCSAVLTANLPIPPQTVIIDNCGHATIVEQPKETATALKEFLAQFM